MASRGAGHAPWPHGDFIIRGGFRGMNQCKEGGPKLQSEQVKGRGVRVSLAGGGGEKGKLWEGTARDRAHCPLSPCQMGLGLSPLLLLPQNRDLSISVHPSIHLSPEHQLGHAANPRGTTQLGIFRTKNSPAFLTNTSGAAHPLPTAPRPNQ